MNILAAAMYLKYELDQKLTNRFSLNCNFELEVIYADVMSEKDAKLVPKEYAGFEVKTLVVETTPVL